MMVLATALLAGSLLATGAQARGGGGGGGGHGGGGGFSAGSMGGFGGGHFGGGGFGGSHMDGFGGSRMALMGRDHYGYGRRGFRGYYGYGICSDYTSYDRPYCTY